jgi:zona occludens toxin
MSIKAYTGRMGSGKTYEVVSVVILGALRSGRRVVSNIAGLDYGAMRSYLLKDGVIPEKIGTLESVAHDAVLDPFFWRTDDSYVEKKKSRAPVDESESHEPFLRAGDLLVLDEVWRFWEGFSARDMPGRVMNFFRMHRHFVHPETGVTCDVALITQDILDIARRIRVVIEETYYMEKHVLLGMNNHYRVDVYSGTRLSSVPVRSFQRTYDPDFFVFYNSHSQKQEGGTDAVEVNIDGRGNILKGWFFRIVIPLSVIVLFFSIYYVWGFFSRPATKSLPDNKGKVQNPVTSSPVSVPSSRVNLIPKDKISELLSTSIPRLAYYSKSGSIVRARIEFIDSSGVARHYSQDTLLMYGWRLFFSPDGSAAFLSNGQEIHVVVTAFRAVSSSTLMSNK